jgi:restriction endonuclease S subunit
MSHVETFKSSIIRIRDLLRSQGITGMDSMRHICLYLMSRYMTKDKCENTPSLGIPDEFTWETMMDLTRTVNGGLQYALDRFYHKSGGALVDHFDRLFGTEKFPFDVKSLSRHKETLEILDKILIDQVDLHMDVLGWVYEQHLKTGSSAARDLGQFFTDRPICTYMTELCRPAFKYPGVPESMCDPAMGTGGFQAAYMKYYTRYKGTPDHVDWAVQQKEIHGCDTDQKVAGLARLNLFMEAGGTCFHYLLHQDSLNKGLPQTGYDVILANMPFGLKGLKYVDCCDRVKALKINGTKSEPLFLQLMMVSLNAGGRCAVVVPDGMLVNTSACHNGTRRYLLDHFELKRVIKMSGKFFMNTGIQPSILFFENTGKPTAAVEFWDVVADGNGAMTEMMVLSVPRVAMDEACSLDMRRYQEVKEVANPAGFPMVKLKDLFETPSIKKRYTNKDSSTTGIPFYNGCYNSPLSCIDTNEPSYSSPGEYLIMIKDGGGDHNSPTVGLGRTFIVSGEVCVASQNIVLVPKSECILKYVYYTLSMKIKELRDLSKKSINLEHLSIHSIMDFSISLPPLAIQHEIVATLDRIYAPGTTELADTLKLTSQAMDLVLASSGATQEPSGATLEPIVEAQRLMRKSAQMVADVKAQMVADVKAQMVAIMKSVGCRGFPEKKLSEACDISKGKRCLEAVSENGYPYQDVAKISRMVAKYILDTPAVLTPRVMSIGRFVYVDEKCHPSDDMFILKPKDGLHPKYLYGYCSLLLSAHFKESLHGVKPTIDYSVFDYTTITIPPLDFQHAVISRLDALQSQLAALESLQRQSEDNARFILESYLHTGASAADDAQQASSGNASEVESVSEDDEKEEPRVERSTPIRRPRSVSPARAAESASAAVAESAVAEAVAPPNYESMSLAALKDLCKARGLRGLSGKKKEELVVILRDLS